MAPKKEPKNREEISKKRWRAFRIFGLLCFLFFIAMVILYILLYYQPESDLEEPLHTLRRTTAQVIDQPEFAYVNYPTAAAEIINLPSHLATSQKEFQDLKASYKTYFDKPYQAPTPQRSQSWEHFEGSLYYISKGRKTWYNSRDYCLSRDSVILSITNEDEQKYISAKLSEPAWIGLTDEKEEGNWEWSDGTLLTVQYWAPGNPRRVKHRGEIEKDCAFISPSSDNNSNWNDDNCHEFKKWICKEKLQF